MVIAMNVTITDICEKRIWCDDFNIGKHFKKRTPTLMSS